MTARRASGLALALAACAADPVPPQRAAATPAASIAQASPAATAPVDAAADGPVADAAVDAPTPLPPPDPGRANLAPGDDEVVGPPDAIDDCEARLTAAGVKFRKGSLPIRTQASGAKCGAPQAVIYEKGPTGIRWNAPPVVTCQLALGLARFEGILQQEAERTLGVRVARIQQGGTYSCRKMARFALVSEHSYGNAIDLQAFELENHRVLGVKGDFGSLKAEPKTPAARFLREVARRAYAEDVFSVVLTPFWDALHADHFHVDQARYRVDATGPRD